ncbi:hypothetical protein BDV35DRAFT_342880 [Aspergillus flavus]|uniref:Uncharacterized protein n=1 Tax=Aspergillus flavus TaxID=5059 RepID=A0A5N6H8Q1_ASPFL|nr:hypothetical protein BDV35DRAFT_342880 [Aspergillus flavus]
MKVIAAVFQGNTDQPRRTMKSLLSLALAGALPAFLLITTSICYCRLSLAFENT